MSFQLINENPLYFLAWILAILVGIVTHEFSHALAAVNLGDDTPRRMGRLSLNPLVHIDWLGFLMLILVGFGWAKPVVFNPHNLRYPKWGPIFVALAGIGANLLNIIVFGIVLKIMAPTLGIDNMLIQFLNLLIIINVLLFTFNLIPIPPLDGSHFIELLPARFNDLKMFLLTRGPWILIILLLADNFLNIGVFSTLFGTIINVVYRVFNV